MSKQWQIVAWCLGLGLISLVFTMYIVHLMTVVPKGMQAAAPPTAEGIWQLIGGMLATAGFSFSGLLVAVLNVWHQAVTPKGIPVDPTNPNAPQPSDSLADLIVAFPAYIGDRGSKTKAMRFWFDLIQVGIEHDTDAETKAWLQEGSEILRKKFFPPLPVDPTAK